MADQPDGMVFDPEQYRIIDISYTVEPGSNPDRPFGIQRGLLADNSYKYDILDSHSHVGSHVEGGAHFYGHDADDLPDVHTVTGDPDHRTIVEYPLEQFYGPGVLLPVTDLEITADTLESDIGDTMQQGDIVVARNDTEAELSKEDAYAEGDLPVPTFTPEAGRWLADRGMKALVLGQIRLGASIEDSNIFHDVLMSQGAVFVEIVDNLDAISRDRFTVMALPYKVDRVGSSFCRAIVVEER